MERCYGSRSVLKIYRHKDGVREGTEGGEEGNEREREGKGEEGRKREEVTRLEKGERDEGERGKGMGRRKGRWDVGKEKEERKGK